MRCQVKGFWFSFQWPIQQLMESCSSLVEVRAISGCWSALGEVGGSFLGWVRWRQFGGLGVLGASS